MQLADVVEPPRLRGPAVRVHRGPRPGPAGRPAGAGVARARRHPAQHEGPQGQPGGGGDQGKGTAVQAGIQGLARLD